MVVKESLIQDLYQQLAPKVRERIDQTVEKIASAKELGEKVVVVTGSGPNIHEGVTTLIAELIHKGIIDGVTTSSAVINHELSGSLEKAHRVDGRKVGISTDKLPLDLLFEASVMTKDQIAQLKEEMVIDEDLIASILNEEGNTIIKAAGNMAYPLGLRTERLAREIEALAKASGVPFETVAGAGADPMTMIGAGYQRNVPVLVSVPQLIGGGAVGLSIADSISITERTMRIARLMGSASVIIESAVALTQEIHDGPFERYTGHGVWADWEGYYTYTLSGKTLVRVDLDPNLEKAWEKQRESNIVQEAIAKGLPKTKLTGVPFRMEMSGFSRLPGSIPIIADIGVVWPIIALHVSKRLNTKLDFISYPQGTPEGKAMRDWVVNEVKFANRKKMFEAFK
jgi:hypothetical protein